MNWPHSVSGHAFASMIVGDFDVPRAVVSPMKADPPLAVDPDAVLPMPIAGKLFEPVAGRDAKIVQVLRAIENLQLSLGLRLEGPKPSRGTAPEKLLGVA